MPFLDRPDAGRRLAAALARYRTEHPVVLALPRGGVPVAAEVATQLGAPLDLVLVRKIGVPIQPELAMGAVVDGDVPVIVRNDEVIRHAGIAEPVFKAACEQQLAEIARRRARYLQGRPRAALEGQVVIVIDDGVATGATMKAALRSIRMRKPRTLVLAVPVAPSDTIEDLRTEADAVVCLETPAWFMAIGAFYSDFTQVTDDEVIATLARFRATGDGAGA